MGHRSSLFFSFARQLIKTYRRRVLTQTLTKEVTNKWRCHDADTTIVAAVVVVVVVLNSEYIFSSVAYVTDPSHAAKMFPCKTNVTNGTLIVYEIFIKL